MMFAWGNVRRLFSVGRIQRRAVARRRGLASHRAAWHVTGSHRIEMKLFRIAALVVLAAATVAARSAGAAPSSGATSFHAAAGAAHTDATHRHAHRRAHRTLARYTTSAPAWPVATRPFPYRPTHPRRDHRADMPRAHRLGRSHGDPRTGSRLMATLPGQTALMATTVTRLDLLQNEGM